MQQLPLQQRLLKQAGQQARNARKSLLAGIVILLSLITNQRPTRNRAAVRLAREGLSKAPSSRSAQLLEQYQDFGILHMPARTRGGAPVLH